MCNSVDVTRLPLLVLLLLGLAAPASLAAAPQPKWTAKGPVTSLSAHTITVNGRKCQITTASPTRATLRLYFVGAGAKIACADGVLRKIDVLSVLPGVTIKEPQPGAGGSTLTATATGNSTLVLSQSISGNSTGTTVSRTMLGSFSVTAIGNGSITGGRPGSSPSLTCAVGDGSPDVGGFEVGDPLSRMDCRNGVLTSITRAA